MTDAALPKTRIVVGAIITNDQGHVLLITNSKWKTDDGRDVFVVPGGGVEGDETPEQALHREIKEEMGIEIHITHRIPGSKIKKPGTDFVKKNVILEIIDFYAVPLSTDLVLDPREVEKVSWEFTPEQLLAMHAEDTLTLGSSMPKFLEGYVQWREQQRHERQGEFSRKM